MGESNAKGNIEIKHRGMIGNQDIRGFRKGIVLNDFDFAGDFVEKADQQDDDIEDRPHPFDWKVAFDLGVLLLFHNGSIIRCCPLGRNKQNTPLIPRKALTKAFFPV